MRTEQPIPKYQMHPQSSGACSNNERPSKEYPRMKTERRGSEDAVATGKRPLVSVIDDDESVRESLPDLLREFGFAARAFSSAEEFLVSDCVNQSRCLILDVKMPGMSGPALQRELRRLRREIPIIFITAHAEETVRSRLLERGASACLFKPFGDTALREALNAALGVS